MEISTFPWCSNSRRKTMLKSRCGSHIISLISPYNDALLKTHTRLYVLRKSVETTKPFLTKCPKTINTSASISIKSIITSAKMTCHFETTVCKKNKSVWKQSGKISLVTEITKEGRLLKYVLFFRFSCQTYSHFRLQILLNLRFKSFPGYSTFWY